VIIPSNVSSDPLAAISNNFILWLDAADYNGTTWVAKKGTNPTKNGTVTSTTYSGKPAAYFPDTGHFTIPSFVAPSSLAVFSVIYQAGYPLIIEQSTNGNALNGFYYYTDAYFPYSVYRSTVGQPYRAQPVGDIDWFPNNTFAVGSMNFDGNSFTLKYNGTSISTTPWANGSASISSYATSSNATDTLYIGARSSNSLYFTGGDMCELIILAALSSSNYETMLNYLRTKYSL